MTRDLAKSRLELERQKGSIPRRYILVYTYTHVQARGSDDTPARRGVYESLSAGYHNRDEIAAFEKLPARQLGHDEATLRYLYLYTGCSTVGYYAKRAANS